MKHKLVDEESKSCFNVPLHVDLDLNENVENANGLDGLHMSGYFFTMGDIDQIENYFSEETYVSSHHSIPPFFPCDEKETSCVVNSSSYFSVVPKRRVFMLIMGHFGSHRWLCQALIILSHLFHHKKWRRELWRKT
jgi:hypothetical protein